MKKEFQIKICRIFRIYRNYDQFRNLLNEGEFIQLSIVVRKNEYSGDLFVQIENIQKLNRPWKKMHLQCPVDKNFNFSDLEKTINNNKGKVQLEIDFIDLEKKISVSMKSKKNGISVSNNFLKKIQDLGIKEYFLN